MNMLAASRLEGCPAGSRGTFPEARRCCGYLRRSAKMVDCPASSNPPESMILKFPDSPYELHQPFPARRRPARGDRQAGRGSRRRPRVPDAARRHRLGQDLHDGQRHRAHRPAGARARAEQDARGAALFRVPRVLPEQRGRVLRLATTTTTSPRPTCRRATSTSRRTRRSTSTSSRCGCRRPRRSSSGRTA